MMEGGANALPWQALGASFPSLSPDPLCLCFSAQNSTDTHGARNSKARRSDEVSRYHIANTAAGSCRIQKIPLPTPRSFCCLFDSQQKKLKHTKRCAVTNMHLWRSHTSPISPESRGHRCKQYCWAELLCWVQDNQITWTEIVFAASEAWSYTALPRSSIFRDAPLQKALLAKSC